MLTLIFLGAVLALAIVLEIARPLAGDLFAQIHQEEGLRARIRQVQADLAEANKRVDTLAGAAKAVRQEVARASEARVAVDQEIENRNKVEPVLVFAIGPVDDSGGGARRCYRAPIKKKLAQTAEPHQTQIWTRSCFVEVRCYSPAEAKIEAHLQFPASHGYAIGPFAEKVDAVESTTGEAA